MNQSYCSLRPIGIISSCYKQKFGIPRQSGLVPSAKAELHLYEPYNKPDYIRGLDGFSHIWLIFQFHQAKSATKATVRPPRLGGNQRLGVFATRSNFRPNRLGLSAVCLESITIDGQNTTLHLSGIDLLDATPVYDIKPYISYSDVITQADNGFVTGSPEPKYRVIFTDEANEQCNMLSHVYGAELRQLIIDTLAYDPRPAYKHGKTDDKAYAMRLYDMDIKWVYEEESIQVTALEALTSHTS